VTVTRARRLNRPKTFVCKSDGSLWFTDAGLRVRPRARAPYAGVYRIAPTDTTLAADCEYPNGWRSRPTSACCTWPTRADRVHHAFELDASARSATPHLRDMCRRADGVPTG